MKAVWVFDEFGKGVNQRDLLMLLASAKLWSIHCPNTRRVLYCSDSFGNSMVSLGIPIPFDEVILLSTEQEILIDTSVFWSMQKLRVILDQKEPLYLVDHDFLVLEDITKSIPENKVCYTYTEDGREYYPPGGLDLYVKKLSFKPRWKWVSANVSFLHLPFPEWTELYAGTSLRIMEEFTEMQVPHSKYLIFAEQLVFKQLLDYLPDYSCLIQNVYECKNEAWIEKLDRNGIWSLEEAWGKKFIHFGPVKKHWSKQEYDKHIQEICSLAEFSPEIIRKSNYLRR